MEGTLSPFYLIKIDMLTEKKSGRLFLGSTGCIAKVIKA